MDTNASTTEFTKVDKDDMVLIVDVFGFLTAEHS